LFVQGTTNAQTVNVDNQTNLGNFTISDSTIQNSFGSITLQPNQTNNPTIVTTRLSTDYLNFNSNYIENTQASGDINITAAGKIVFNSDTYISGNLHATGDITFDGNITFGNANTDIVTFDAEVASDILPQVATVLVTPVSDIFTDETSKILLAEDNQTLYSDPGQPYYSPNYVYDLGSLLKNWLTLYVDIVNSSQFSINLLKADSITSDRVHITANQINSSVPNGTIYITSDGTGQVNFSNFLQFGQNTITNISNSVVTFINPGASHFKFANGNTVNTGANALVIPVSDSTTYIPEQGTIRYNPTTNGPEVYSSTDGWLGWFGPSGTAASTTIVEDESLTYTLMLGL